MRERYSSDWHDEARELYEIGLSLPDIGRAVDRKATTIKSMVTHQGWSRNPERFSEGVALLAMEGEEFRQVGDRTWVSSLGRVIAMSKHRPGVIANPGRDKDGYLRVGQSLRSWEGSRFVSHLVLEAFEGPCPPGMEAAHLDGSRDNNARRNLAWVTHQENCAHKEEHGTHFKGARHPRASVSDFQAYMAKRLAGSGATSKNIAAVLGMSTHVVNGIRCGNSWRHL